MILLWGEARHADQSQRPGDLHGQAQTRLYPRQREVHMLEDPVPTCWRGCLPYRLRNGHKFFDAPGHQPVQ